jgi:hypothetical protein
MKLREIMNRHQMIRFFDGYVDERIEELGEKKLKRPLVKTPLLEMPNGKGHFSSDGVRKTFERCQVSMDPIDESPFSFRGTGVASPGISTVYGEDARNYWAGHVNLPEMSRDSPSKSGKRIESDTPARFS